MENGAGQTWSGPRTICDAVRHGDVEGPVLFFPLTHPDSPDGPLTLLVGYSCGGQPCSLLINEEVTTAHQAWKVVLADAFLKIRDDSC
jgi:hypothetical protein